MGVLKKSIFDLIKGSLLIGQTVKAFDKAEEKVEKMFSKMIKAVINLGLIIIGIVFVLIGFSQFISSKFISVPGSGFLIVGAIIVLLVILFRAK